MAHSLPDWRELPLAQQVAQMVIVRASGCLFDHQIQYPAWEPPQHQLQRWIREVGVGGVILLGGSAAEVAVRSHQLQTWANIPLFLAADIEEGVGQRFAGASWFPPPMAIAALAETDFRRAIHAAEGMGAVTAQEAIAIGLNWVLAPVVDVNNNALNPVINVRAFGDTPERVSQLATAFIRGTQSYPVLNSAKHFPGHGDTAVDSHLELPLISHDWERLRAIELPPFKAAIAAGVSSVMSAHLRIPALDADYPATLSHRILTGLLRNELSFDGLIVTDALVMGAIAQHYGIHEAPVMAVEAGADILLMPPDPEGAIAAVCAAVESGRIAPERIQASIERIWQTKQAIAPLAVSQPSSDCELDDCHTAPTQHEIIQLSQLSQPTAQKAIARILEDSMQVRVPQPLPPVKIGRNVIVIDTALDCEFLGHHTPAIARLAAHGYQTLHLIDRQTMLSPEHLAAMPPLPTVLQLFVRGNPFRGSAGLTQRSHDWLKALITHQHLRALIIYGSPYALEQLQPQIPELVPCVFTYGQMPVAQAIALAALGI